MTLEKTCVAMMALGLPLAGCRTDDRSQELRALERRVSTLEAAARAEPPPRAPATGPSPSATADPVTRLQERIDALEKDMARMLKTARIPLEADKSGNEICAEKGHICLSVVDSAGSARYDMNGHFCGHITADCNSRVARRKGCGAGNDYVLSPVKFHRSPAAKAECDSSATETCASSPADITAICLE